MPKYKLDKMNITYTHFVNDNLNFFYLKVDNKICYCFNPNLIVFKMHRRLNK